MVSILVINESPEFLLFKSQYGVTQVVAPGGKAELTPGEYKAAALIRNAAEHDLYPESATVSEAHRWHETKITNIGRQTLIFQPFPVKLPPTIIKPGQTEALHFVRYKVTVE